MTNKNDIIQLLKNRIKANTLFLPFYLLVFLLLVSCAKMGQHRETRGNQVIINKH